MSEEILVNLTPQETRVAVVDNGVLQEIHIERERTRGLVGNIYKGKVVRVLPGMQAAFIEIGLDRTGFLHVGDLCRLAPDQYQHLKNNPNQAQGNGQGNDQENGQENNHNDERHPPITELLHDGEEIIVQVLKDPIGSKGARLTSQITIPARSLVFLPHVNHVGISQRIQGEEERARLKDMLETVLEQANAQDKAAGKTEASGGFIVRTAAELASDKELMSDVLFLRKLWARLAEKLKTAKAGTRVYEDIPLSIRVMRDLMRDSVEKVRIDSRETFEKVEKFARELLPEVVSRIEHYPGERPIFDLYSVEDEIKKALERTVPLKSGGHIVFDQTEAMTTVDVNTGGYVGRRTLEETIFKTNLEAAQAIARQLRLRNIGGIIIVDFIDMTNDGHKRQVLRALEKTLTKDRTKTFLTEISPLGLVEITRKRSRESMEQMLMEPCVTCGGRGVLKTPQTVCYEIFRDILREARQFDTNKYIVLASQIVIDMLLDEESTGLADLQEFIGKPINLQVENGYHQELFDVVLM